MNMKCGIISIIGRSNVGKSTIFNGLMKKKMSIVTKKKNTTRSKILGIKTDKKEQMVFIDTPGIYSDKKNTLHHFIKKQIKQSLEISQTIIFVIEALKFTKEDNKLLSIIKTLNFNTILIINKIDLLKDNIDLLLPFIEKLSLEYKYKRIIPFIAKKKDMIQKLDENIKDLLPKNNFLFKGNKTSNKKKIFFLKEILREKILKMYNKEIPYSVSLDIANLHKTSRKIDISINIYVKNIVQKKILLGAKGKKIKLLSKITEKHIETYLKKKIFLKFFIKKTNEN